MTNNKKILILFIFVMSLLTFTSFLTLSRYTSKTVFANTIRTKELKINFVTNGNNNYNTSHSSVVNIIDTHSNNIVVAKYTWSTSNNFDASSGTDFVSGDNLTQTNGDGTYYLCVYVEDDKGFNRNECSNAFMFDNTAPTASITSTNNLKSNTQVATLTMSDNNAVDSYYFGKTNPEANTVTWTDYTSSPVSKNITTKGKYYFAVKDKVGNMTVKNITYYSYDVINMLQDSGSTFTSTDYIEASRYTYIAPRNTTITLTDVYTIPEYAQASRFQGYSLGEPSTAEATPDKITNPTLTSNSVYTMWFIRNRYYFRFRTYDDEVLRKTAYYSPGNDDNYNSYVYSVNNNGYIMREINGEEAVIMQSSYISNATEINLPNHKSGNFSIEKIGYEAVPGQEWVCISGCTNPNQTFTQDTISDFNFSDYSSCDLKTSNCIINLRVNWQLSNYNITYDLGGGTVSTANPTTYNVNSSDITLNNPQKAGYTFEGWTEQTKNIPWLKGFIDINDGSIQYNATYPDSYFTEMFKIKSNTEYAITSGGSGVANDVRWRSYDLNKFYQGSKSGLSITSTDTAYERLMYYNSPTTSQMNNTIITNDAGTTATIPSGSVYDKNFIANWQANKYKIEYYQGSGSNTSTKFATSSTHTYNTAKNLTTYASLGGTAPSGWTFAGWSTTEGGTTVTYTDGQSVKNLTAINNGTIKLYAVFKRDIIFQSGASAGTIDLIEEQYYNPYATETITSITSPASLTAITGWTATGSGTGYRNNATAGSAQVGLSTSITPAYNDTSTTYYGVYRKVINVYSGVNKETNNKKTQYLNTNGNVVSAISLAVPADITDWTKLGYREDTTADVPTVNVTTTAVSVTPAYSTSAIKYYAVYSKDATVNYYSGQNAETTVTQTVAGYYNTNDESLTTEATFTLKKASDSTNITGWTEVGWRDDTSAGNREYTYGQTDVSITLGGTLNLYSVYSRNITLYSGVNNETSETKKQYLNTNNNTVGNVSVSAPTAIDGWTALGYRDDTTAGAKEYGSSAAGNVKPAFSTEAVTLYAVYSRTLTITYAANNGTGTVDDTTATIYLNTNSTATSSQEVTLSNTTFTRTGYRFSKWTINETDYNKNTSYDPALAYDAADASWTITATAKWAANTYTVEYYQGAGSSTSTKFETTSSHRYDTAKNLTTYATLGGTAPSGWTFAGWSTTPDGTTVTYTDGQSVSNLTSTHGGTVSLYAVFSRTIRFNSGVNKATKSTATQYYNPYTTSTITAVSAPAPSTTNLSGTGWGARGYRADTSAADRSYAVTTAATNITPAYNVATSSTTVDLYAVYSRTVTLYHGKNKASNSKPTQYYTSANAVSAISAPAPSTTNLSGQSWGARGYRADTSAADRSYAVTTAAANISPAYNVANTLYAVYSRTVTLTHNGNGNTGGSTTNVTGTQYYTSNNSVSTVTLTTRANGFTRTGYNFSKWAVDSTSGTQIAAGASTTFAPGVDSTALTKNVYAIWSAKSLTCTAGKYLPANSESCANCTAGSYCPGGTWTYNGAEKGRGTCPAGSYSGASASGCTACQGNTSNAGSSSCNKSCGKSNVGSWNTASWNSSNNTVSNVCSIKTCANGYTLQSNNCNDVTAPSVPTKLELYNPVLNSSTATYSLKVSGSSDVNTITYQVKINGSWQNCSNGVYNGSLANSSTSYTIEARACDSIGNCSESASRKIWLNPKRLYVWQLYQYMRTTNGSTIMSQPTEDEVSTNSRFDKSASNANGMYNQTEANNNFNSWGATQTVKNLYRGIFGRDADSGGLSANVTAYNTNGRAAVIKSFVNSTEAQNIYSAWGIGTGTI